MINRIKTMIKKKYNDRINIELIRKSDFFSKKYYLLENPDVKMDPAKHYYYYGYKEGRSPSYDFSNDTYLRMYKDVKNSNINPLVHYLKYGKKENRKIKKDNGLSLSELYYKITKSFYNYNFYNDGSNLKRLNLFLDDDTILQTDFVIKVMEYCKKYVFSLRIIYKDFEIESLKDILKEYNIKIEYLYLNNNDFIFIGNSEKIICNGYKTSFALKNSNILDRNFYIYLNEIILNDETKYYLSQITSCDNAILITDNKLLINSVNNWQLDFNFNEKFDSNKLYYKSDKLFLSGLFLLNQLFLDGVYKSNEWTIHAINNNIKYHLETNVITYNIKNEYSQKADCLFYLASSIDGKPKIIAYLAEKNEPISFKLITSNNLKEINDINSVTLKKDKDYKKFKELMIKARSGDIDV